MPTPTEMLTQLQDRLASLPEQVAEAVGRAGSPAPAADAPGGLDAVRQAVQEAAGQAPGLQAPATPAAPPMPQQPVAPPGPPASPWTPPGPPQAPDTGDRPLPPPQPSELPPPPGVTLPDSGGTGLMPPQLAGGGDGQVVELLTQIHATLQAGGGRGQGVGPGREPPRPMMVPRGSPGQFAEGYAGGASPSMDVSNIAGSGGASSRRGYGTHATGGRYWQPESDDGVPR